MRSLLATAIALAAAVGCVSKHAATADVAATRETPPLTVEQRQKNIDSFDVVWTTIRDKHFDPKYNGVDWNAVRAELRPKVEVATSTNEARGVMQEMLERLGQTHFEIIPAAVYRQVSSAKRSTTSQPKPATSLADNDGGDDEDDSSLERGASGISLRLIDDKLLVTKVDSGSGAEKAGVKTGWELTAIRGKLVTPLLRSIGASYKAPVLRKAMQSRIVESALSGDVGETITATFDDGRGRAITSRLTLGERAGEASKFGNLPLMNVQTESTRIGDGKIEYFALSIFLDPARVMPKFHAAVEDAIGQAPADPAKGFILDLRGNPGGIGFMAVGMSNLFVSKSDQFLGQMTGRQGPMLRFVLNPQAITYTGPVAVLIDECSMSTSEIMAGGLKDIGRARVFGTRSAGAALPSIVEKLPNGDRFQYAIANYISASGKTLEANGVVPDEIVEPTQAALLAGHDLILESAVRWIKSKPLATK